MVEIAKGGFGAQQHVAIQLHQVARVYLVAVGYLTFYFSNDRVFFELFLCIHTFAIGGFFCFYRSFARGILFRQGSSPGVKTYRAVNSKMRLALRVTWCFILEMPSSGHSP